MNSTCQPLPQSVVEETLQIAARAICHRPGDTAQQRASRTRQMVYSILGFEPRDGLEYMMATMVVGHFHLILESMHSVFQGQMDSVKAKTKTGIVSLDRAMLAYVRELRLVRHRPLARWAEDAQRQAEATEASQPIETPEWIAAWAGVPQSRPAAPPPEPAIAPVPATTPAPSNAGRVQAKPAPAPRDQTPDLVRQESHPAPPPPDDEETRQHIAAFEKALAALTETLEEARALDDTAATASGD
jgi:hypothetical protein